ncbi:5'-AMP-activated protein kinase subunit beta-1 isoform X2 [Folsomia candida]|uniref:5'-AMP-activated protein kinase subunit beta-1 isoform X2 n=1 Tax=Folsomia candida TaxID=158441 RepID=UPI000B903187|nr:5'-AMP-activated protein kinase subunit beta-1 isoform X2 [Folsomia candida]
MGNANSGNIRDRHKSGDSLPPSSPCGMVKDGQAFSFDKRPSEDYPETGRPRSVTVSEGTNFGGSIDAETKILPTVFKWDGGGKTAFICGTFSDWKTIPMVKSNFTAKDGEDYVAIVDLPEGEHQYKFLIDDEWKFNPSEPTIQTEDGTVNNIITVRKTDFEVFDALAMDQCNSKSSKATQLISGSPPGSEWGQDIPSYKPWEKTTGPPILPPHLLQVILNKDTPLSCEPTLLPEPNHVMLNHLYALSIKDGVMVLSATHRYRKKYVTTLLYKPI